MIVYCTDDATAYFKSALKTLKTQSDPIAIIRSSQKVLQPGREKMADWRVEEEGGSSSMPRGMFTRVRGGGGEGALERR